MVTSVTCILPQWEKTRTWEEALISSLMIRKSSFKHDSSISLGPLQATSRYGKWYSISPWKTNCRGRKPLLGVFHRVNCKNMSPVNGTISTEQTTPNTGPPHSHPGVTLTRWESHSEALFGDLFKSWGLWTLRKWWFCPNKHNFLFHLQLVLLTRWIAAPTVLAHSALKGTEGSRNTLRNVLL